MLFKSVFGGQTNISFEYALLNGFASDGSMIVPDALPHWPDLTPLQHLSYCALMQTVLAKFVPDELVSFAELGNICARALKPFHMHADEPLHLRKFSDDDDSAFAVLELFHGPSLAFKDFGMQVIAELIEFILNRTDAPPRSLVVATSGDTGAAALAAFAGRRKASIVVLYPKGKVSPTQERQMTAVSAPNAAVFAVTNATSDSLDIVLARLFADAAFAARVSLGSVNSVNVVRILCQTVHFFWGYFAMCRQHGLQLGERVKMALPSGALGNAVSALFAQKMGLPIDIVVCNTATNNVTSHFVRTGEFKVRQAVPTIAPAIDIGDPYNIQRVFYFLSDGKTGIVRHWMSQWSAGHCKLDHEHLVKFRDMFAVTEASESEMAAAIATQFAKHNYLLDPHTAVAWVGAQKLAADKRHVCVVATASPLKFLSTVEAILPKSTHVAPDPRLAALDSYDHSIAADQTSTDQCVAAVRATVEELAQRLLKPTPN